MKGMHFLYKPLNIDGQGTISRAMYKQYLFQSFWPSQLETLVIEPLNNSMKESDKSKFDFQDFKVNVSPRPKKDTSWGEIYEKLKTFLEIRSDDSRAGEFTDLKYKEGIGYCISIESILKEIKGRVIEFTSSSSSIVANWPKIKKTALPVRDIIVPDIDYSQITREAALVSMQARRFKKSLTEEVINAYKRANEIWLKRLTGYDRENIPPPDESPIKRIRHVGGLRYIVMNLIREDKHDYKAIIKNVISDLTAIGQGEREQLWEIYRPTVDGFVNIKKFLERLNNLYTTNTKPDVRYEIVP